jgi:hypothetical protein
MDIELRQMIGHRVVTTNQAFSNRRKSAERDAVAVKEAGIWIESQAKNAVAGSPRFLRWFDTSGIA